MLHIIQRRHASSAADENLCVVGLFFKFNVQRKYEKICIKAAQK